MDTANPNQEKNSKPPIWAKAVLFGLIYLLFAAASTFLSVRGTVFVSFWLPGGLYMAVLLLNPRQDWLWLCLATLPASLIFDLLHGTKFILILFFFCANTVQAIAGAWLIRRFVAEQLTLATLKEFLGLLAFGALLGPALGATVGATALTVSGLSSSFATSWELWWGDNAMAVLILSPFILVWFSKSVITREPFFPHGKRLEALCLLSALIGCTWHLLFVHQGIMTINKNWILLPLLWAGLRFGLRGAVIANLLLSLVLAFFTTQFFKGLTSEQIFSGEYVFILQSSLAVAALVGLIPAIIVSERDKTTMELRGSEERLKNLAAASFEGVCISENGRILDTNNQMLAMFGFRERDEIIGRQIIDLVAPASRTLVKEAVRTGRETVYEHELQRKDGSVFFGEAQARMVKVGDRTIRMTALRDITERKRAEEALRNSEALFRSYFELAMVGCAISTLEKGLIAVNDEFCKIVGYPREELVRMTWVDLTHPDDITADEELFQRVLAGEINSYGLDKRYIHKSGREIFISLSVRCVRHPDGSPDYFIGLVMDISDRREAALREQRARTEYTFQLIASQEAERERIATELHDSLGQNLLIIKNRAQLALTRADSTANLREQMESISDLASQAIAEVRHISHDLHPYQLGHLGLTRAIEAMIDRAAEASSIAFEYKLDPVDDVFSPEAALNLYRVIQENLNNILKHSRAKQAHIKLERDVHEVQLQIIDDGCGFNQNNTGEGRKGMGLKNIAERVRILKGKLKTDSQTGRGTQITVTIPIVEND